MRTKLLIKIRRYTKGEHINVQPQMIIEHQLPWITDISHTEKPKSPNFAD